MRKDHDHRSIPGGEQAKGGKDDGEPKDQDHDERSRERTLPHLFDELPASLGNIAADLQGPGLELALDVGSGGQLAEFVLDGFYTCRLLAEFVLDGFSIFHPFPAFSQRLPHILRPYLLDGGGDRRRSSSRASMVSGP